jgi:hypothetical protein
MSIFGAYLRLYIGKTIVPVFRIGECEWQVCVISHPLHVKHVLPYIIKLHLELEDKELTEIPDCIARRVRCKEIDIPWILRNDALVDNKTGNDVYRDEVRGCYDGVRRL